MSFDEILKCENILFVLCIEKDFDYYPLFGTAMYVNWIRAFLELRPGGVQENESVFTTYIENRTNASAQFMGARDVLKQC